MKKVLTVFALIGLSSTAFAGFNLLTTEKVVTTVLESQELAQEKDSNSYLSSLPLKSISIQSNDEKQLTEVYLTYQNSGAPCTVKAEVKAVNTVPAGAAGVNMVAQIETLRSACAVN